MPYPNLEAEMARKGVTQKDIAELVGKSPETVNNWLRGRSGEFTVKASLLVKERLFPGHSIEYLFDEAPASD